VDIGTLFHLARKYGYTQPQKTLHIYVNGILIGDKK